MATATKPLAARMRPTSIDEIVGQDHLLGDDTPFRAALQNGNLPSLLLWGPPGCGKTSMARLLADQAGLNFLQISAVMDGIKELRKLLERARDLQTLERKGSLLLVDEIHRWNKAQQDALLPHVEEGTVVLVGATTENPGFQIIPALRSRCWLLTLNPLDVSAVLKLLERTLSDDERGLGARQLEIDTEALTRIAQSSSGDGRRALSILERVAATIPDGTHVDADSLSEIMGQADLLHDRDGDAHYDVVSAFIKSLRGSDPQAALYWCARMLEGGEDPMFVARRLVIFASEDIGNADARALQVAVSTMQGVHLVGMPEARIILGQAVTYLASAPKSNRSYLAINAALQTVRKTGALSVPAHLRNAPTDIAKKLGHGDGYQYPHDFPNHIVQQEYLPPELAGTVFYRPAGHGGEKTISERLQWWDAQMNVRKLSK
jgi:putative ATPase